MTPLAVIVWTDEVVVISQIEDDLKSLQGLVGGNLEGFNLEHGFVYFDEDGISKNLPVNKIGTTLARMLGWAGDDLRGCMVFVGMDSGGRESDVPIAVLEALPVLFNLAGRTS